MAGLRVLLVEDDPLDAELVVRELQKSGYDPEWQRVDTAGAFLDRLAQDPPDVIISDHVMPQFSSAGALERLHGTRLSIPFIVVSHAIGEEEAVRLMRNGATDYLMKDRLGRIGEAVRQALEQQALREEHAAAQRALMSLNRELERRIAERTAQLESINRDLESELDHRAKAEQALHRLNADLERRVEERTRDLVSSQHSLRALASELTLAEQRERKRLAAELHDYLAQMLALGRMKIAQLRPKLDDPAAATPMVKEIDELFSKALTYTRSLMAKLSPPVLDELGLPAALTWLAEQMPLHGLTVDVRLVYDRLSLPDDQAVLLFQSVRELLINVAKHAETDRATVTLLIDQGDELRIEVQDAGCGFDPMVLDRRSAEEHFGLFSVKERMQAMGGRLDVRTTPGKGSTMTLVLPLAAADEAGVPLGSAGTKVLSAELGRVTPSGGPGALRRKDATIRVLLVDDHVMVRQGLKALLEGYPDLSVIGEAGDGEQAVEMAGQLNPDFVLMDINMPKMDGIEATKRIKAMHPETMVIGLSVNNSLHILEAMTSAGAVAFVSKDAAADQLYDAVLAANPLCRRDEALRS